MKEKAKEIIQKECVNYNPQIAGVMRRVVFRFAPQRLPVNHTAPLVHNGVTHGMRR